MNADQRATAIEHAAERTIARLIRERDAMRGLADALLRERQVLAIRRTTIYDVTVAQ